MNDIKEMLETLDCFYETAKTEMNVYHREDARRAYNQMATYMRRTLSIKFQRNEDGKHSLV